MSNGTVVKLIPRSDALSPVSDDRPAALPPEEIPGWVRWVAGTLAFFLNAGAILLLAIAAIKEPLRLPQKVEPVTIWQSLGAEEQMKAAPAPAPVAQAPPAPKPAPKAPAKAQPKPVAKAVPKPPAAAQKQPQPKPDIALQQNLAKERTQREEEAARLSKREHDERKRSEELAAKKQAEAAREAKASAEAERDQAALAEGERQIGEHLRRIERHIQKFVVDPPGLTGTPVAQFRVLVDIPSGKVIGVQRTKSSGIPAYDAAAEQAIKDASPLPMPERRDLQMNFRQLEPLSVLRHKP